MPLSCIGYDYLTKKFQFLYDRHSPEPTILLDRSLGDLQHLSRLHKKRGALTPLPSTVQRNLATSTSSWQLDGPGWQPHLSKSLQSLNAWINTTLASPNIGEDDTADFCDDERHSARLVTVQERIDREAPARKLQQYFCSELNRRSLVRTILDLDAAETGLRTSSTSRQRRDLIIFEPSFGDGRVLEAILASLKQTNICTSRRVALCGTDLDPGLLLTVNSRLQALHTSLGFEETAISLHVWSSDFLAVTAERIAAALPRRGDYPSERDDDDDDAVSGPLPPALIFIGCPPYTQGGGSGALSSSGDADAGDVGRDLPLKFLVHCARLRCASATMLLPERCGREAFIARALEEMNAAIAATIADAEMTPSSSPCPCPSSSPFSTQQRYHLMESYQADDTFQFAGRDVRQPAIIQVYSLSDSLTPAV